MRLQKCSVVHKYAADPALRVAFTAAKLQNVVCARWPAASTSSQVNPSLWRSESVNSRKMQPSHQAGLVPVTNSPPLFV